MRPRRKGWQQRNQLLLFEADAQLAQEKEADRGNEVETGDARPLPSGDGVASPARAGADPDEGLAPMEPDVEPRPAASAPAPTAEVVADEAAVAGPVAEFADGVAADGGAPACRVAGCQTGKEAEASGFCAPHEHPAIRSMAAPATYGPGGRWVSEGRATVAESPAPAPSRRVAANSSRETLGVGDRFVGVHPDVPYEIPCIRCRVPLLFYPCGGTTLAHEVCP